MSPKSYLYPSTPFIYKNWLCHHIKLEKTLAYFPEVDWSDSLAPPNIYNLTIGLPTKLVAAANQHQAQKHPPKKIDLEDDWLPLQKKKNFEENFDTCVSKILCILG